MNKNHKDFSEGFNLDENDLKNYYSSLSAAAMSITNSLKSNEISALVNGNAIFSEISANLSAAALSYNNAQADYFKAYASLNPLKSSIIESQVDLTKVISALPSSKISVEDFSALNEVATLVNANISWQKITDSLSALQVSKDSFADISKFVESAITMSKTEFLNTNFDLSKSVSEMEELAEEVADAETRETDIEIFSEEQLDFILSSLEEWLEGKISFKNTLDRVKGSKIVYEVMKAIVFSFIMQITGVIGILDDPKIHQEREIVKSVQQYMDSKVTLYSQYKKYYANSEDWLTYRSIGLTRTEVKLRKGRSRTAPLATEEVLSKKTAVLMFELKNNWREIEVEVRGTYIRGWVPESTITRLKPIVKKVPIQDN
ncbi:hypothetical protein [Planococcus rifietoensis]|uniref:hypothetical protein n=1 Tax=Planococcus rifietoensis TaxID=200991 RepID=UPI00384E4569